MRSIFARKAAMVKPRASGFEPRAGGLSLGIVEKACASSEKRTNSLAEPAFRVVGATCPVAPMRRFERRLNSGLCCRWDLQKCSLRECQIGSFQAIFRCRTAADFPGQVALQSHI